MVTIGLGANYKSVGLLRNDDSIRSGPRHNVVHFIVGAYLPFLGISLALRTNPSIYSTNFTVWDSLGILVSFQVFFQPNIPCAVLRGVLTSSREAASSNHGVVVTLIVATSGLSRSAAGSIPADCMLFWLDRHSSTTSRHKKQNFFYLFCSSEGTSFGKSNQECLRRFLSWYMSNRSFTNMMAD